LFLAAGIDGVDPKDFRQHEINGRQIKNSIRLAQALAASENRKVSKEFLESTLEVAHQFESDLLAFASKQEPEQTNIDDEV